MKLQEFFYRAIIGLFNIVWKITGGQLILGPVVSHALAADSFAGAGVVGTIATLLVGLDLAFHLGRASSSKNKLGPSLSQVPMDYLK